MNEPEYLRGRCDHCGGDIEFPENAVGQSTACPLCQQTTILVPIPATVGTAPAPAKGGRKRGVVFAMLGAIGIAVAGVVMSSMRKSDSDGTTTQTTNRSENTPTPSAASTTGTAPVATNTVPVSPTKPRSIEDLKTGPVSLEKAKNSSLVYAVGVLRNESDHQRFGVTVEVELTDARGNSAGTAKDYRAVIEPRQEWQFRALILNSKATAGTVAKIREE